MGRTLTDLAYNIADALVRADDRGLIATAGDIRPLRELLDAWREVTGQPWNPDRDPRQAIAPRKEQSE